MHILVFNPETDEEALYTTSRRDADFAANGYIALGNNRDLFLNSIAWLVEEEEQIGERPDASETLAIDDLSAAFLCLVSIIFVPGGVGLLAVITWWRRRRL